MNEQMKAGSDIHAGDGGYREGTQEGYEQFAKTRNQSLAKMRIRELVLQAGSDTSGKWMSIDNAEKFAQLIAKECADITNGLSKLFPRTDVAFDVGYTTGTTRATKEILKHFGVE
jgi:hypothetical protein